jgi:penicillin-binding protein 2
MALALFGLLSRAVSVQIVHGEEYRSRADANRLRKTPLWPRRGVIRDRSGIILADNQSRFQVTLLPSDLPKLEDERQSVLGEAARIMGQSINDLIPIASATGSARDEVTIVGDRLTYDQAMAVAVALPRLPGFALEIRSQRRYPQSADVTSLSHVLGYVGKLSVEEYESEREKGYRRADEIGKSGVERFYETVLRGTVGYRVSEADAHGRLTAVVGDTEPVNGADLRLTLDVALQRETEQALRRGMARAETGRGAVIAMDPRDGSVLALVSLPSYDNNFFAGGVSSTLYQALIEDRDQPLFPRAWAGTYPSGSTVKIIISAAALAEKIITPATTVLSVGGINVGPWFFPDWKAGGHGTTNVRKAIAWSVNTFYYTIGGGYESFVGLGVDRLTTWMRAFGLGSKSGIDVASDATGFVPSKEWKEKEKGEKWYVGDTYNLSIGQGDLLVTPVQVAAYTSAIANGGRLARPHLNAATSAISLSEPLADASAIETVRLGMRDNVVYGSGRALADLSFPVAGKTGTAQWSSTKKTHAWFTAFAPFESPEIVVTVLLEEGGEGSSVSVPVAREVLNAWWRLRQDRGGKF